MSMAFDPHTLRELVDTSAVQARLDELGNGRSAASLAERTGLLRLLGRLDEALQLAEEGYRVAHFSGDREQLTAAKLRRAQVFQYQGKLPRALADMTACRLTAEAEGWVSLEAFAAQHEGKVLFEMDRMPEARDRLEHALELRKRAGAPHDQIASSEFALEVVRKRISLYG